MRVLLLKRNGASRVLTKWNALVDTIKSTGVKLDVYSDDQKLPPHEIFRMFDLADIVVAAHGAGLSNIIAARQGTLVIEIVFEKYLFTDYVDASRILGLRHVWVVVLGGAQYTPSMETPLRGIRDVLCGEISDISDEYPSTM
jgi:capsular polysaccharide biosynthesis protein